MMRVTIRPSSLRDFEVFVAAMRRSRPLHRSWISRKPATRKVFKQYTRGFAPGQHCRFLVIHRQTGDLVGVINLNDVIRGHFQNATVGYYAFLPYAGQGLMREGLQLVLKHAFQKLKLHRVEADIQPRNRASIALVKKCGFVCEGRSRRMVKICGRWRDHERWVILAEDLRRKSA